MCYIRKILIILSIIPILLRAGNLEINSERVHQELSNTLTYLNSSQELPLSNFMVKQKPQGVITINYVSGLFEERGSGNFALWSGINVSGNFMLSGVVGKDLNNARSYGTNLTYITGVDSSHNTGTNFIDIGINLLEGPRDFEYNNYHISIAKKIIRDKSRIILGFSQHYNQVSLNNIENINSKTIKTSHFRVGVYKNISDWIYYGLEFNFWNDYFEIKVNLTGLMP